MPQQEGLVCWNCGRPTGLEGSIMRSDACPHCLADLRCCRGCRHFDPFSRFQCRETIDAPVGNKDKANFCDWYQHRDVVKRAGGIRSQTDSKDARKKRFDDLFED